MFEIALKYPTYFSRPIPRMTTQTDIQLGLSRAEVLCILVHAFLCTWGKQPVDYNTINFSGLYSQLGTPAEGAKFRAIIQYFQIICSRDLAILENENIIFHRQVLPKYPNFQTSTKPLSALTVLNEGKIEEAQGQLQTDFAHRMVGGGVISGGNLQEEIRYAINTELIASCLFTSELHNNEVLIIKGTEQFSKYTGYGFSLRWNGAYVDITPKKDGIIDCTIVAMDATNFGYEGPLNQYKEKSFAREVKKAFTGFYEEKADENSQLLPVATGNWGCGAFMGDKEHKGVLQLLAASEAGRAMTYYAYGDPQFAQDFQSIYDLLVQRQATVGTLWKCLKDFEGKRVTENQQGSFFQFLFSVLN